MTLNVPVCPFRHIDAVDERVHHVTKRLPMRPVADLADLR